VIGWGRRERTVRSVESCVTVTEGSVVSGHVTDCAPAPAPVLMNDPDPALDPVRHLSLTRVRSAFQPPFYHLPQTPVPLNVVAVSD
jgi:hypothetical protein